MPNPARAGLFIYAKDKNNLSRFYTKVAGMKTLKEKSELTVLESPDIQLLAHGIPANISADITITTPPARRQDTALKFFFTVASLEETRTQAEELGGEVWHENWEGPGFIVCNAIYPEGNVFQVRQMVACVCSKKWQL